MLRFAGLFGRRESDTVLDRDRIASTPIQLPWPRKKKEKKVVTERRDGAAQDHQLEIQWIGLQGEDAAGTRRSRSTRGTNRDSKVRRTRTAAPTARTQRELEAIEQLRVRNGRTPDPRHRPARDLPG